MDTIHDTPKETYGARIRRAWRPKAARRRNPAALSKPQGRPYSRQPDWHTVALVGAGIAAGVVLGAGIALLVAPQSGAHTRLALSRELRRNRPWRRGPWERLGDELRQIARHKRRRGSFARDDYNADQG